MQKIIKEVSSKPISSNVPVGVPEFIETKLFSFETERFKKVYIPNLPGS